MTTDSKNSKLLDVFETKGFFFLYSQAYSEHKQCLVFVKSDCIKFEYGVYF
jgi:hypothetical protein